MNQPEYGEKLNTTTTPAQKPKAPMTAGSWVILGVIIVLVVALLGPLVINLWKGALGL